MTALLDRLDRWAPRSYDDDDLRTPPHFVRVSRAFTVRCPKCGAPPGTPCDERASRDTPGNQFHWARIAFFSGRGEP